MLIVIIICCDESSFSVLTLTLTLIINKYYYQYFIYIDSFIAVTRQRELGRDTFPCHMLYVFAT